MTDLVDRREIAQCEAESKATHLYTCSCNFLAFSRSTMAKVDHHFVSPSSAILKAFENITVDEFHQADSPLGWTSSTPLPKRDPIPSYFYSRPTKDNAGGARESMSAAAFPPCSKTLRF